MVSVDCFCVVVRKEYKGQPVIMVLSLATSHGWLHKSFSSHAKSTAIQIVLTRGVYSPFHKTLSIAL